MTFFLFSSSYVYHKRYALKCILLFLFPCPLLLSAQHGYYGRDTLRAIYEEDKPSGQYLIPLPGSVDIRENNNHSAVFNLADHLGSTRVITDDHQVVTASTEYDPYGKQTESLAATQKESCSYTGTYTWCQQSGLYSSPTRKYAAVVKRFMSPDPIRQTPGPYIYTAGNPLTFKDPDGAIITISWEEPERTRRKVYRYDPNRPKPVYLEQLSYQRAVEYTLDHLYPHLGIDLGTPGEPVLENFLDRMANDTKVWVNIFEDKQTPKTRFRWYNSSKNIGHVIFNPNLGAIYDGFNVRDPFNFVENDGKILRINTPRIELVHELIHARSYLYDYAAYNRRGKSIFKGQAPPFPDEEEAYAVHKTNIVAAKFNEGIRFIYEGNAIPMPDIIYHYQFTEIRE